MANISPQQQQVIDQIAASLSLENPADVGSLPSWKKTLAGYFDAVPGTYYYAKLTILIGILRSDPTLDQTVVEKLAKFVGL